ncbi:hypothetical protein ACLK1U_22420 [Escherichia coli]
MLGETIKDVLAVTDRTRNNYPESCPNLHALAMMLTARSYSPPYKICRMMSCCPLRVRLVSSEPGQHRRAIPQHFAERRSCQQPGSDRPDPAQKLKNQPELSEDTIKKAVESLSLELVLTAHPT